MELYDRVKLASTTDMKIDGNDKYNPLDTEGTIVSVNGKFLPIIVKWDNGIRNSYYFKNLKKI